MLADAGKRAHGRELLDALDHHDFDDTYRTTSMTLIGLCWLSHEVKAEADA